MQRGIYVAGLREEIVASPQQVLNLMDFGECISLVCCWLYISQLSANVIIYFSQNFSSQTYWRNKYEFAQ